MDSFGRLFRLTIFGESHGPGVGVIIDGCPAGIPLDANDLRKDLDRRRAGAAGTTARREPDVPELLSGVHDGHTTGAPVAVLIRNADVRSADYADIRNIPRPGHADFAASVKFDGFNDPRGGGAFSGRLTAPLVAAGVVAKKVIAPVAVEARLIEAGGASDVEAAAARAAAEGDSIGGIVACVARDLPAGLGEPFFDSVESLLAHILFAVPAVKGIEFGAGFRAARMKGSEHNDPIVSAAGRTSTNNAGGVAGGLTNGNPLEFRVAVKPAASIAVPQDTFDLSTGTMTTLRIGGRHDACIALRVPVVVEAVTAVVLADLMILEGKVRRVAAPASSGGA